MSEDAKILEDIGEYKYGFHDRDDYYAFKSRKGLDREVVEQISYMKGEPKWMLEFRLKALDHFLKRPMPNWGPSLKDLDLNDIYYYVKPTEKQEKSWDDVPDDIKRTFDKLGVPEAERKFLAGLGAQYECLSGDARVYTARGLVPIKNILPGDVVFSLDEAANQLIPAQVKAFMPKGERPVYAVKVGTRTIRATENHPFLVLELQHKEERQRGRYVRSWKYLRDIKPGDLVAVAKALPDVGQDYLLADPGVEMTWRHNPVELPRRTNADLMWWLGLYMGDGFIHREGQKARVEFAIPETDVSLRSEFKQVTSRLFGIQAQNGDPCRMTVGSSVIARYLEVNGFSGGALEKRVPAWVASLPREQILAFLGGYVDSDGYVRSHAKNKDILLTSANPKLLEDVRELAALCGIGASNIHRFEGPHPHDKERTMVGYRLLFSGDFDQIGCRSEQRRSRMEQRKFHHSYSMAEGTSFRNHVNEWFGYARVESITPAGVEPVYDIEVDGPHNFVAEGLIVHNSEMVYHSIQKHLEEQGVIFLSIEDGLKQHPDLFREYFGTVIPIEDNKFAALNSAVWSGGSFVYVPKGVKVDLPLQAYFRLNTANVGQFERTLIIVDEGASVHYVEGCFLAGAQVRTRNGEKPIEQIEVGDEVMTHLGRWRKVYHTQKRPYHNKIYSIRFYGDSGRELRVTAEHPLLVVRRQRAKERNKDFQLAWARADSVKEGDYLVVPVPQPVMEPALAHRVTVPLGRGRHTSVDRQVNLPYEPDFFRLLGYYFAEGHVDNEHYLTFSFHADETVYLADVKELIERYFGKAPIENQPRQNGQTLVLSSTEIARTFARAFGANVHEKRIPEWVSSAEPPLLAELVKGMWRGDGSYDPRKNMFRYNTVSADLAYAFRDACLRLGAAASVNVQERTSPRKDLYAVVIASPFNSRFGQIVGVDAPDGGESGSPFALDENFMYLPIREITVEEMETEVYNFSVEEDESYVAEGVVSHNCTAPQYTTDSFHSGVIEIIVKKGARSRYSTIQNWSHNVYNLVTQRAKVFADATHEWVDANMGCLAEGSTVTTPQGLKKIEDLQIGDQVLSYDESAGKLCFRAVTAKRYSGEQPVHTVSVGERHLTATANHPFYSYRYDAAAAKKSGRYRFAYLRADELKEAIVPRASLDYGRPRLLALPQLDTTFHTLNQYVSELTVTRQRPSRMKPVAYTTDDLMWLFGYWLGDGNIDIKPAKTPETIRFARVGFSTPPADRARQKLLGIMSSIVEVNPIEREDGHHLAWNSKELAEFFQLNGFAGRADTKRVPQWVWSLPESQRLAFIAGYLDADGTIAERKLILRSVNRGLLSDIASLLVTLGITARLYTEFSEPRRVMILGNECIAHGAYRLSFFPDERFAPYLSPAFRQKLLAALPRKLQMRRAVGRSNLALGEDVEIVPVQVSPAGKPVRTWDIEVEGTGNFVSQGFIVHNSKLTMKYPSCYLMEPGAHGEMLSMAFAGAGQIQDAGSKMVHFAPNTSSKITSKSISKAGGRASYRGLLKVYKGAKGVKSNVVCDALLLDPQSRSDTYPYIEIDEDDVTIGHEASVSKVGEEQLFYLMSRGLSEEEATTMVVSGFIEPLVKELPMEYAVEMNRLIALQMEGSIG